MIINLNNNGRAIAKNVSAYEAFIKIALLHNFTTGDVATNRQLDEIQEIYYLLDNFDLCETERIIYNHNQDITTLSEFKNWIESIDLSDWLYSQGF